jgi:hypothetical protein
MKTFWRSLFVICSLLVARSAGAVPFWQSTMIKCIPNQSDIANNTFNNGNGWLQFDGTTTGFVTAYCSIPPSSATNPNALFMNYLDQDGTGGNYQSQGIVYSLTRGSGTVTQIVLIDSNSFADTTSVEKSTTFSHTFNFTTNAYFARIRLARTPTTNNPRAYSMSLEFTP